MSWSSLPTELKLQIVDYLRNTKPRPYLSPDSRQEARDKSTPSIRYAHSYAHLAAVNREWQAYFEPQNFKHLILGSSDLLDFRRIISRFHRGNLLQWIWLRVELPEYDCDKCSKSESLEERIANEIVFTTAILELLFLLSNLDNDHPGIMLELSAHSPSDSEHHCKELRHTLNDTVWHVATAHAPIVWLNDEAHGWRNGRRPVLPARAFWRVFGNPLGLGINLESADLSMWKALPKARAVKNLFIRLQFLRHISIRNGLAPIIQGLPRLSSLSYECRKGSSQGAVTGQACRQQDHRFLFKYILRHFTTLRNVTLYEEESHTYSPITLPRFVADPVAGQLLGLHSSLLKELHVAWMVDAGDFFHNFWPDATADQKLQRPAWPQLRELSLTTGMLVTVQSYNSLLQAAAAAAERMPKLQIMELWGYKRTDKFLFLKEDRQYVIVVVKEKAHYLSVKTIQCWQRVAASRGSPCELKVEHIAENKDHRRSTAWKSITTTSRKQLSMARQRIEDDMELDEQ